MKLLRFVSFVNEAMSQKINEAVQIQPKDWERMSKLVLKDDDGYSVARLIRDKNKAIARFVAGTKLNGEALRYDQRYNEYSNRYRSIGNKALALGATHEEIQAAFDQAEVPVQYTDRLSQLRGAKLNNRFVSAISSAVIDLGLHIEYLRTNGSALTWEGREAMARNGRKWTIGYKSVISGDGIELPFEFDAITDEGGGPTYYVIDQHTDADLARKMRNIYRRSPVGVNGFVNALKVALAEIKTEQAQD